jgi:hypothetical protein
MKRKTIAFSIVALALIMALVPAVLAGGPSWGDNFDGYAPGTDLHNMNGWKGWFNDPSFTAFTSDAQARTAPNSVDIVGNADLVHEYSENAGFWLYRASQYIPGNLAGQSYFIMLNQYDDAGATNNWSVQVIFDGATGMLSDTGASGATATYVADQWVDVCLEIDLVNDTQEFYYNGASVYTGSWSGHVSGGGVTAIGAVDLFANGASSVYYDDMYLTAGAAGDCQNPSPMAGISMEKTVGTDPAVCAVGDEIAVASGTDVTYCYTVFNTGDITLDFHTVDDDQLGNLLLDFPFSLSPGAGAFFTATTNITETTTNTASWAAYTSAVYGNASDTATVNVLDASITMNKTVGTEMGVCADTDAITVVEGATVYYCYEVMNTGSVTLSLHDLDDDQLGTILDDFVFDLAPGASVDTVAAGLDLSAVITQTTTNTAVWTAFNADGTMASFTDEATVTTREPTDVSLSSFGSEAGTAIWPAFALVLAVVFVGAALIWRRQTDA